ncbi:MAG: NapC/NirT family cytochrome c [Bacillota bacterium]|nr:NapC/NirT family cytochrome c [Bacillota bacterium]
MTSRIKEKLQSYNKWFLISIVLILGIFLYAGSSYAMKTTDQAAFCSSCHVMNEKTRTFNDSVHASLSCNDCHAPEATGSKLLFKTKTGTSHLAKNISGNIEDVIHSTFNTKEVVKQNCISCHSMTNKNVMLDAKDFCTDCHRHVPHLSKKPIGERMVAGE